MRDGCCGLVAERSSWGVRRAPLTCACGLDESRNPHEKKTRQWIKARGSISPNGGHQAHLSALAYISDSRFVATIARVHNLWRSEAPKRGSRTSDTVDVDHRKEVAEMEEQENGHRADEARPQIGMMVSLDHTIFFHRPKDFRADEWMYTEMESPWAGDGRGLVFQKIWTRDGKLVASCVQEVRSMPVSDAASSGMVR